MLSGGPASARKTRAVPYKLGPAQFWFHERPTINIRSPSAATLQLQLQQSPSFFSVAAAAAAMRAITGAVVSSEPCALTEAHNMLYAFCRSHHSDLASDDCATYLVDLDKAIKERHKFLRRQQQQHTTTRTATRR